MSEVKPTELTAAAATNAATLWQAVTRFATATGLDASLFGPAHQDLVAAIATFLATSTPLSPTASADSARWWQTETPASAETVPPVSPIIISGIPGTGKTTFLALLDGVLRHQFGLPDGIRPVMTKADGSQLTIQKRELNGRPLSLLSVHKLAQLLHFYAWDLQKHGFVNADLDDFIYQQLAPMRIIFADEVETTGFSPTIPDLASRGLLVVGSSNQTRFEQLEQELVPPHILTFTGADMRQGNPAAAVVPDQHPLQILFDELAVHTQFQYEFLTYGCRFQDGLSYLYINFQEAIYAPLLETRWVQLFQETLNRTTAGSQPLGLQTPLILLLDQFSLDTLAVNHNATIRFISLFDAIEQHGLGAFVRHAPGTAKLTPEAIATLKQTIRETPIANIKLKQSTLSGIDRWSSRLGQAAIRAWKRWPTQS